MRRPALVVGALACLTARAIGAPVEADDARAQVQAAEATLAALALDASDSAVLVGLPTDDQRARVRGGATEALAASIRAADALARALEAVEDDPAFYDDESLRDLRSELAVEYGEYRLPLVRARSALLLAATDLQHRRAPDLLRVTVDSAANLDTREPALAARRAVILALAGSFGGPVDGAAREQASEAAFALGRDVADVDPHTAAEAALQRPLLLAQVGAFDEARRLLTGAAGSPPFVRDDGAHEAAWRLLLADAMFRVDMRAAAADTGQMAQVAARRAFGAYDAFLKDERATVPLSDRRALAIGRLQVAIPADAPADALPPLPLVAQAWRRAGERGFEVEAIRWLGSAVESRPVEDVWMRAELRFALASMLLARADADPAQAYADRKRALALLTAVGVECAEWPDAPVAVEAACRVAMRLPDAPEDGGAIEGALRLAVGSYPTVASIDRWRLALAERVADPTERRALLESVPEGSAERAAARALLLGMEVEGLRGAEGEERARRATAALALAEDVRGALAATELSPEAARAIRLRTDVLAIEALLALGDLESALALGAGVAENPNADRWLEPLSDAIEARLRSEPAEQTVALASMLIETSRYRLLSDPPQRRADDIRATLARALVLAGRPDEAAPILDELRASIGPRVDILRAGAEAAFALGDDEKAFGMYRQIVTPLEGASEPGEDFWLCWSRMLQILGRRNDDGARSETIRREILRLRTIDSTLGGEPYASRIVAVEASL